MNSSWSRTTLQIGIRLLPALALTVIATRAAIAQPFAYVANEGSSSVSGYTVDPVTGNLTELAGSPFSAGGGPTSVKMTP